MCPIIVYIAVMLSLFVFVFNYILQNCLTVTCREELNRQVIESLEVVMRTLVTTLYIRISKTLFLASYRHRST